MCLGVAGRNPVVSYVALHPNKSCGVRSLYASHDAAPGVQRGDFRPGRQVRLTAAFKLLMGLTFSLGVAVVVKDIPRQETKIDHWRIKRYSMQAKNSGKRGQAKQ